MKRLTIILAVALSCVQLSYSSGPEARRVYGEGDKNIHPLAQLDPFCLCDPEFYQAANRIIYLEDVKQNEGYWRDTKQAFWLLGSACILLSLLSHSQILSLFGSTILFASIVPVILECCYKSAEKV